MLTMRPQRRLTIPGTAALMAWNDAERLIAMMASHFSSGKSSIGATNWIPALLTRMSQAPSALSASATIARISAGFDISAGEYATLMRYFSARPARSFSISAWSPKPLSRRLQPCSASAVAMPRPMPLVEPVTMADLPLIMGAPPLSAAIMLRLRDKDDSSPGFLPASLEVGGGKLSFEERLRAAALLALGVDLGAHAQDLALHVGDIGLELGEGQWRQVLFLWRRFLRCKILVLEHVASGLSAKPQSIASLARSG